MSDDVKIKSQSTLTSEIVQTDKSVPTVRERLKNLTQYLVMDSESAEKSAELIQQQINKIQEWRDESLNAPNEPIYFLHGGEVYDRIQNQGVIALNEDGERIPIPDYEISQNEETRPDAQKY